MAIDKNDSTEAFLAALAKVEMIVNTDHFECEKDEAAKKKKDPTTLQGIIAAKTTAKRFTKSAKNSHSKPAKDLMREKMRHKSEGKDSTKSGGKIFYREEKNGKVTYEFNATYRKPSDSGWVSETQRPKSKINRKRSQSDNGEESPVNEKLDIFDVTSAKLVGKDLQIKKKNSTSGGGGSSNLGTGGLGPKKMVKPKMDLAKALATMGFGTARIVDAHGERDAQDELNDALTRLMEAHEKKKKKILETEKIEERKRQMSDKLRDEVRTVHEAYQFLAKKYKYDKQRLKEKQLLQAQEETLKVIEDEEEKDTGFGLQEAMTAKTAAGLWKKTKADENNSSEENVEQTTNQEDGPTAAAAAKENDREIQNKISKVANLLATLKMAS